MQQTNISEKVQMHHKAKIITQLRFWKFHWENGRIYPG